MMDFRTITQWQTGRVLTAADTPLVDYRPAEVTSAVKAKMISVAPATGILVLPLCLGNDGDSNAMTLSGWMHPDKPHGPGPGFILCKVTMTSGGYVWGTAGIPHTDGLWPSGVYRFVDTIAMTNANACGAVVIQPASASNEQSMLLIPTLGFTHILMEWTTKAAATTTFGTLWRPAKYGDMLAKTNAYS